MRLGLLLAVIFLTFCGCTGEKTRTEEPETRTVFAMDTVMSLQIYGVQAREAADAAVDEILRLEKLFSVQQPDSEVAVLNRTKTIVAGEDTAELVSAALQLYRDTEGAFDVTILPLMRAWNFTGETPHVPKPEELARLLKTVGASGVSFDEKTGLVELQPQMELDFGGIAKGYTGKRLAELLQEYEITGAVLSLGGNIQTVGKKPDAGQWRIAIKSPEKDGYLGTVLTEEGAVVTSGGYERYFEENGTIYHHILDPSTGYPADNGLVSVTVLAKDGTMADGLSTALFVMGTEAALSFWREHRNDFEGVFLTADGTLWVTKGLSECFFSERPYAIVE